MILDEIISHKRKDIQENKLNLPEDVILKEIRSIRPTRSLSARLAAPDGPRIRVIAEIKKASPSRGVIRKDFDPALIASQYENAGASAISVVTELHYFQGGLDVLEKVRSISSLPLLRKDFLIDPYQILEARYYGADAVLLIVRALPDLLLEELLQLTQSLGMEALVEVHDEYELERAQILGARLIGINNRDLSTFQTDIGISERLARKASPHVILVSESGIYERKQILRLQIAGIKAFLIGENLMKAHDPGQRLKEMVE
jgi:indole-3-glycerol phosphate synthase